MIDREKVIAKFEKEVKKTYSIKTTIYNNGKKVNEDITEHREPGIKISMEMAEEILALLKEPDAKSQCADSGMCEICSFYERSLPVKPHYNARTNWYECGACKFSMTSGMHCKGILIPAYKVGFCAKCGKAVKWDG